MRILLLGILLCADSAFVIRELLLGEKSARMVANALISIGSEVSLSRGMIC